MRILKSVSALFAACALATTVGCSGDQAAAPSAASGTIGTPAVVTTVSGNACGVSELKANPDQYLGPLTLTGKAAKVYPTDSVIEIADEKACCALYLFVPFTEAQRAKLGTDSLYAGTLPAVGTEITADAELTKVEQGYLLKVKEIRSGDAVLVAMK